MLQNLRSMNTKVCKYISYVQRTAWLCELPQDASIKNQHVFFEMHNTD
jgi:hypothetical protein